MTVKEDFWAEICCIRFWIHHLLLVKWCLRIRRFFLFFCHCHVMFAYNEIRSFTGHWNDLFSYMEPAFFLVKLLLCFLFQIYLLTKRLNNYIEPASMQWIATSCTIYSKTVFFSAEFWEPPCEKRLFHCSPQLQDVPPIQLQISHFSNRRH